MTYFNAQGQGRVGWRSLVVTQVVNAVDADAQAFISAAGITNLTQASAVNVLVNDLKTYGLWTKMKALYPMVGGTATSHKFNLKDPRDLDAAYRLVFNGGWVHSSTGAKPNGTTGYANSFLAPNAMGQNNIHVSFYSRTDINALSADIGAGSGSSFVDIIPRYIGNGYVYANTSQGDWFVNPSSTGLYIANRIVAGIVSLFKNNTKVINGTRGSNPPSTYSFYLGAENNTSVSTSYSSREQAFASIGDGLTDTEATNFYNSVQKFQTTLGRQIGSPIVSDTDAQAFINAAGLTDLGQANAVNTLVVDLKAAGVWTKMKALYPFVGGTATTHKWNLKDPRDLDAAFRLVFNGGWTHTATGALPNGTTGYADTKLNVNNTLDGTNSHLSYYSRTTVIPGAGKDYYMMGAYDLPNSRYYAIDVYGATPNVYSSLGNFVNAADKTISNTKGLFLIKKESNNNQKVIINNTLIDTQTQLVTLKPNYNIGLAASINNSGVYGYSTFETAFASIGDGLTDTEASSFYTAVQKYQTTLGRQIGTPVLAEGQTAGLLETYSGAAAAYSLRKLRNGYYGNAIRVRRSSDNAEQDIAFKADGTLDTVSLLAFVGSGNGFVTTWYDQSGYNNHIIQTTAANQPQVVSSGSVILDGTKPAVQFNGTTTTLNATFSGVTISGLNNMAVICACKTTFNNAGVSPLGLMYFGPDTGWGQVSLSLQAQNVRYRFGTGQSSNNPSYNYSSFGSLFSKTLLSTYHQGVNEVLRINGSDRLTYNNKLATIANTGNQFGMGGNYTSGSMLYHQGTISEMIIYVNDQMSNRAPIESNINTYYSIY